MNPRNVREEWMSLWQQLQAQADAFHDSQSVAFGLLNAYDQLSAEERVQVHPMLAEWLVSNDNRRRYDARFVITERAIRELAPSVASAICRLKDLPGPEARDEVELLEQLQEELTK
jgi:hypothetical protein